MIENKNMALLEASKMWIDGEDLKLAVEDETGYIGKYSIRIAVNDKINAVEAATKRMAGQLKNYIAFGVQSEEESQAMEACLLNKALLIKDQIDTRDFSNYPGRIAV